MTNNQQYTTRKAMVSLAGQTLSGSLQFPDALPSWGWGRVWTARLGREVDREPINNWLVVLLVIIMLVQNSHQNSAWLMCFGEHRFGHTTHPQVTFGDKNFMTLEENVIENL